MHEEARSTIALTINGTVTLVPEGCTVAVAMIMVDQACRISVSQQERGPLCAMGICYECRMTVDGTAHRLACQTVCIAGMDVQTDG